MRYLKFIRDAILYIALVGISLSLSLSSAACGCWLHHWLGRGYAADAVSPLPVHRYPFCRPRKDDRLSQPPGVLIQRQTGLELRTLGSQAATLTTELTPGVLVPLMPGVGLMVMVIGLGAWDPEFKSPSAVKLIPGGVDSACHPSVVSKMNAS